MGASDRTLATFSDVEIATGSSKLVRVRIAPKEFRAFQREGVRRVRVALRTTTVLEGGERLNGRQLTWLKIPPLGGSAPVTG